MVIEVLVYSDARVGAGLAVVLWLLGRTLCLVVVRRKSFSTTHCAFWCTFGVNTRVLSCTFNEWVCTFLRQASLPASVY